MAAMDFGSLLIIVGLIVAAAAFLARPLVEGRPSAVTVEDRRRSALQAEREVVLALIHETEMDHAMGKVDDAGFQEQRAALVARGAAVLRELDSLGGVSALDEVDGAIEAAVAARRGRPADRIPRICAHCGRTLQQDDRFCPTCGTPTSQERRA
jgi:hypothetical protein